MKVHDREKRTERIKAFLDWENTEEAVEDVGTILSTLVSRDPRPALIMTAMHNCVNVCTAAVASHQRKSAQYDDALHHALCNCDAAGDFPFDDDRFIYAFQLPLRMMFPKGNGDTGSESTKRILGKFADILSRYEELIDSDWAKDYSDSKWLKKVLSNYKNNTL